MRILLIDRLKNKVLPIIPIGYSYKIKDYLKSKLGKALDNFFDKKDEEVEEHNKGKEKNDHLEKISRNPANWETDDSNYEKEILEDYGKNRRRTNMENRYNKMKPLMVFLA